MKTQSFDGFHVGQQLSVPEIDQNSQYLVEAIIPGGMGVCIKLVNLDTRKPIALKGIQKELLSDRDAVERFKKELNIWYVCASLDGVVDTHGIVMINNIPYMASEWCAGGDLSSHLGDMTAAEKISTFLSIADALKAVHDKYGVIHRDLKPQNVLVDEQQRPLISDWGLAKIYADHSDRTANAGIAGLGGTTAAGMGTLLYMSPEQLRRDPSIDFRSDIYALGCILHELETGEPPYLGRTPREVVNRHFSEPPPKLGSFFRRTNLGLEKVITRCLQKSPADRYQSYEELLRAVSECAKKRGVVEYPRTRVRYERALPGSGYDQIIQKEISALDKGRTGVLSEQKYMAVREEADMLVGTGRYAEAIKLLRPLINVENVRDHGLVWHVGASDMESYAHALMLNGEIDEADRCYQTLAHFSDKHAAFYVNRACLYLQKGDYKSMQSVCEEGLKFFPKDKDILGNAVTAYMLQADYEVAFSMLKRSMALGADVYDYECLYNMLKVQSEELRYTNLNRFAENMKNRYLAISRGLALNRTFPSLCIAEVEFRCAVYENDGIGACEQFLSNKNVKGQVREKIVCDLVDAYVEYARFGTPEKVSKAINALVPYSNDESVSVETRAHVRDAYFWLLLQFVPDIRNDLKGKGSQTVEWLTLKQNGRYRRPLAAVEVLHRLGRKSEAFDILNQFKDVRNWYAHCLWTRTLIADGEYDKAVAVASHGTELMPEHREVWSILHHACLKVNNVKEANRALAMAKDTWSREQAVIASLRKLYSR